MLMPSNPAKADRIATRLDNAESIGRYREFVTWTGTYQTTPVSVISTGVGCPSTAIAAEEVLQAGAKILIRIGTCGGSWRQDIPCGSLAAPTACIREEGTSLEYMPASFPSVADLDVIQTFKSTAADLSYPLYTGLNRTHDAYYGSSQKRDAWAAAFQGSRVPLASQPILSSEMECSILYLLCMLRGARAGCILAVNADPEPLSLLSADYTPTMKSANENAEIAEERSIDLILRSLPKLRSLL